MRRGAFFINLSRGSLVDEAALERALDLGRLGGAAMDVGSAPDEMPPPRLAVRPDVLATPHIGGLTQEAVEHQAFDSVRQVAEIMPDGCRPARSTRRGAAAVSGGGLINPASGEANARGPALAGLCRDPTGR
ncbi:MAG: NAD(P)-dependent oxidoreductase [Acetobacteraceae bacterium]